MAKACRFLASVQQSGVAGPDEGAVRRYHSAWEVGELTDLVRARRRELDVAPCP